MKHDDEMFFGGKLCEMKLIHKIFGMLLLDADRWLCNKNLYFVEYLHTY